MPPPMAMGGVPPYYMQPPAVRPRPPRRTLPAWAKSRRFILIAVVAGVFLAGGGGGIAWLRHAKVARQHAQVGEQFLRDLDRVDPTAAAAGPADREKMARVGLAFEDLRRALHDHADAKIANTFDGGRFIEEAEQLRLMRRPSAGDPAAYDRQIAAAACKGLVDGNVLVWDRHEVRRIRLLPGGDEAIVGARMWFGTGRMFTMRWWARTTDGGRTWRWYDCELEGGWRDTVEAGADFGSEQVPGPAWASDLATYRNLRNAANGSKWDQVDQFSKTLDAAQLPAPLEAEACRMRGLRLVMANRYADALKQYDRSLALRPDCPNALLMRAKCHDALGQYDKALADSEKYRAEYANNNLIDLHRGYALAGLKRYPEAAAAFHACLDDYPDNEDALVGLARMLPAADKSEVGVRMARSTRPKDLFRAAASALDGADDAASLEVLVDAYRQRVPGDVWAEYHLARSLLNRNRPADAAAVLEPVLPKLAGQQKDVAAQFTNLYLTAKIDSGDPMAAYKSAADPTAALRRVAWDLIDRKDVAGLRQIVALHRAKAPDDPWADYFEARTCEVANDWQGADRAYTRGLARTTTMEAAEPFRAARVYARYKAGRGVGTYQTEDDTYKTATFAQLARLIVAEKRSADLVRLVDLRRQTHPADPTLPLWRAEAFYLAGDWSAATSLLLAERGTILSSADSHFAYRDHLIRCLVRLGRYDDALAEATVAARAAAENARQNAAPGGPAPADAGPVEPNSLYVLMVRANQRNVAAATAAFEKCIADDDYDADDLYDDPEIGPALKAPAFAALRAKHPPAEERAKSLAPAEPAGPPAPR